MTDTALRKGITRRSAVGGMLGTAALAAAGPGLARNPARKPNFLFIMADDFGWADLSCYGRQEYATPAIDSLAAQGMQFMHGYANSAVCSATRMGLITGRYQYRLRAGLEEPLGGPKWGLPPEIPTLPSLLKKQGYHSALVGKWHLGSLPKFGPLQSGYDEFWGNRGGGVDYYTHKIGNFPDLWDGDVRIEQMGYYTNLLADRSIQYLEARAKEQDKPWLLSLHFTAAHWPWEADNEKGRAESARIDAAALAARRWALPTTTAATWKPMPAWSRRWTAMSDESWRGSASWAWRRTPSSSSPATMAASATATTGRSTASRPSCSKEACACPSSCVGRASSRRGARATFRSSRWTSCRPFSPRPGGAPDPAYPADGVDIHNALAGSTLPERPLFWRFWNKDQKAARRGQYKYLSINGNEYLFDIVADPQERANLAKRMPGKFAELKGEFEAWNKDMIPYDKSVSSFGFTPRELADHFGWND